MNVRRRIALKLCLLVLMVFVLIVWSASEYDFVYRAF